MEINPETIILSTLCAFVGFVFGVIYTTNKGFNPKRLKELKEELETAKKAQEAYEERVVRHFGETAQLVNRLTDSYRDVHSHLADGAEQLCQGESTEVILRLENDRTEDSQQKTADPEPPRDYAPKASPLQTGVLNESFGIKEIADPDSEDTVPSK